MTAPFHLNWKISLAVGAVLILGGVLLVVRSSPVSVRQPLKIGYSSFPPYQLVRNDGSPDGFAVQTLKEAARRLGQPLQWTRITGNPDQALDSGQVDLYPMLAILPDRLARFAISPPWWENALVLISPAEAPLSTADSTVGRKIALINASFGLQRMRNLFPQAFPLPASTIAWW